MNLEAQFARAVGGTAGSGENTTSITPKTLAITALYSLNVFFEPFYAGHKLSS